MGGKQRLRVFIEAVASPRGGDEGGADGRWNGKWEKRKSLPCEREERAGTRIVSAAASSRPVAVFHSVPFCFWETQHQSQRKHRWSFRLGAVGGR